ncbi:hypothetical protein N7495_006498 [Penicillium taxi]|uniref:uncharacterized protein n=1 Tax=Penicillium taxi TaxID=168475 RepID=UPI00254575B6|nr:uncharacterized protein N7495_006498 [Penicillium taxi]KAJ5894807.1 hypothetical protein N7495_006498 [Penicillium taxi]
MSLGLSLFPGTLESIPSARSFALSGMTTIVTTTASILSPTGEGTKSRCAEYYKAGKDETCTTMADKFSISRSDL